MKLPDRDRSRDEPRLRITTFRWAPAPRDALPFDEDEWCPRCGVLPVPIGRVLCGECEAEAQEEEENAPPFDEDELDEDDGDQQEAA